MLESNSSFLLQELQNKQIIIEKLLENIPSNSDNMKTVKNLSENKRQKVQHREKQQEKLLETIQKTIEQTDQPQKVNRNNADKNKEPKKKDTILGD